MNNKLDNSRFKILLGENLRRIREDKDLSLRQLAQRCDVDYSNIGKIEKGKMNITLNTIFELIEGLEITAKELFDFDL